MKFRSIDNLQQKGFLDENNSIPYFDLSQTVWTNVGGRNVFLYVVDRVEEMRLDTICYKIYGNTDYVDFLMFLNDIINPLNITEGQTILYVNLEDIPGFKVEADILQDTTNKLLNLSKAKRVDKAREDFLDKPSLPPTVNTSDVNPIQFENGRVIVGRGLFNS